MKKPKLTSSGNIEESSQKNNEKEAAKRSLHRCCRSLQATKSPTICVSCTCLTEETVVVDISAAAAVASGVNIAAPLAQNVTSGNTTGKNLTTSEERGAYSEYGG